jgi:hypothetical protein
MLFHEVQYAGLWVFAILGGVGLVLPVLFIVLARVAGKGDKAYAAPILRAAAVMVFLLASGIFLYAGKMTTEVDGAGVRVTFGWLPFYQRAVPAGGVAAAEAVEYDPAEFGGSGIRGRGNDRLLSQSGTKAARLTLKDGGRLLIGSQRAEELAEAVRKLGR